MKVALPGAVEVDVTPGRYVAATKAGISVVGLERYPLTAEDAEALGANLKSLAAFQRALRNR